MPTSNTSKPTVTANRASKRAAKAANAKAAKQAKPTKQAKAATPAPTVEPGKRRVHSAERLAGFHYGASSVNDNDERYIAFFAAAAREIAGSETKPIALADIVARYRNNPFYTGAASASSINGGYISRLEKHGFLTRDPDARTIAVTARGAAYAANVIKRDSLKLS